MGGGAGAADGGRDPADDRHRGLHAALGGGRRGGRRSDGPPPGAAARDSLPSTAAFGRSSRARATAWWRRSRTPPTRSPPRSTRSACSATEPWPDGATRSGPAGFAHRGDHPARRRELPGIHDHQGGPASRPRPRRPDARVLRDQGPGALPGGRRRHLPRHRHLPAQGSRPSRARVAALPPRPRVRLPAAAGGRGESRPTCRRRRRPSWVGTTRWSSCSLRSSSTGC